MMREIVHSVTRWLNGTLSFVSLLVGCFQENIQQDTGAEILRVSSQHLPFSRADVHQPHSAEDRDLCRIPIAAHLIAIMNPTI